MDEAEQVYQAAQAELAEADRAYSAIYGIRRAFFAPTHIGLGTWGRQEPLAPKAQESARELQRTRARHPSPGIGS